MNFSAEVVLLEPEIPQNTGNIARTCAALGCPLHLIEPLGFSLEDRYLRRAGLDYWPMVEVKRYPGWDTFFDLHGDGALFFFTRKAGQSFYEADFRGQGPMYFIFGKESVGLPGTVLVQYPGRCFCLPMRSGARSLNLSSAVAVVLYEVFRQNGFPGLVGV